MPATKTNEMAFNVHLFNVLRTKHPRWRDHAGVEQTGVFRDMERALIAADIMPAATHLTASMLSSVHPGTTFGNTRVHTLPYGQQSAEKKHAIALGALDLIEDDTAPSLFGTGILVAQGTGADVETEGSQDMILPRETADLVIMNPPFTRPTNHEKTEVPVPSFAGLNTTKDEQQAMAKRLKEVLKRLDTPVGNGNAGLASNFIDLAYVKVKPGGVLALVLPAVCVSGGSWKDVRDLLAREYEDVTVLTIATHGQTDRAFSADTGMAEALIVATKCSDGRKGSGKTLYINFYHRPRSLVEAVEMAGERGLLHRDISEENSNGTPRGPFEIISIQGVPQYPVLWSHNAPRERSLVVLPDSEGEVRPGCDDLAVSVWKRTASRLHFNLDFGLSSQSLAACLTPTKTIGGRAWPNFIPEKDEWTFPLVLWANTTLGLLAFWWIGSRQQKGRAILTITRLPGLTVLDPRTLSSEQIAQAEDIFSAFKDRTFLPANEAYRDNTRQTLDRAVLVDLLHLPKDALEPLAILRDQWCAEPSVHGGKKTRIGV